MLFKVQPMMERSKKTCFQQWLDHIRAERSHPEGDVMSIWHGTRRKETPEEIKRKGFCTWSNPVDVLHEVVEALDHFGKLDKIKDEMVQNQLSHICRFGYGKGFYVDVENEESQMQWGKGWHPLSGKTRFTRTCSYANNNPEVVSSTLACAGVEPEKINQYLREKYGKPYAIKLKGTIKTFPMLNLQTPCLCFEPEDIEEVYECPEVEEAQQSCAIKPVAEPVKFQSKV